MRQVCANVGIHLWQCQRWQTLLIARWHAACIATSVDVKSLARTQHPSQVAQLAVAPLMWTDFARIQHRQPRQPCNRLRMHACTHACCCITTSCSDQAGEEAGMQTFDGEATAGNSTSNRASHAAAGSSGLPDSRSSDSSCSPPSASTEAQSASLLLPRFRDCSAAKPGPTAQPGMRELQAGVTCMLRDDA